MTLIEMLEHRAASFYQGVLEGKALATHAAPSNTARQALALKARNFLRTDPYGRKASPSYHADMEAQFKALQTAFRAKLRGLYRNWEKTGNIDAFKAQSEKVFKDHYTKVFQLGMTSGDLSRHTNPGARRVRAALVTPADRAWIASAAKEELGFWKKFLSDLRFGRVGGDPFKRIDMYVKSAEAPYHAGKVVALPHQTGIRWRYSPIVEKHCAGCLYLASQGPYTKESLPCTPRDGSTLCRFNCKCELDYFDITAEEYVKLSRKSKTWLLSRVKSRR